MPLKIGRRIEIAGCGNYVVVFDLARVVFEFTRQIDDLGANLSSRLGVFRPPGRFPDDEPEAARSQGYRGNQRLPMPVAPEYRGHLGRVYIGLNKAPSKV